MSIHHLKKLGMVGRQQPADYSKPAAMGYNREMKFGRQGWQQEEPSEGSEDLYADGNERYSGDDDEDAVDDYKPGGYGYGEEDDQDEDLGDDSDLKDFEFDLKDQTEAAKKTIKEEEERERKRLEEERLRKEREERLKKEAEIKELQEKMRIEREKRENEEAEANKAKVTTQKGSTKGANQSRSILGAADTINSADLRSRKDLSNKYFSFYIVL